MHAQFAFPFTFYALLALLQFPFVFCSVRFQQKYAARIFIGEVVGLLLLLFFTIFALGYIGMLILPVAVMAMFGGLVGLTVKGIRLRSEQRRLSLK